MLFFLGRIIRSRNGAKILISFVIFACVICAVIGYSNWAKDQEMLKEHGQPSFNTLPEGELVNGLIVKGKIDMALDVYAEEYETTNGIRTSDKSDTLYYVVPVYDKAADGSVTRINYLITYKADPEDFNTLGAIVEHTWYDTTEPTPLILENAKITALPGDVNGYFTEWANDPRFYEGGSFIDWCSEYRIFGTYNRELIESKMVPYMIQKTDTAGASFAVVWISLVFIVLCVIILILIKRYKAPSMRDPAGKDEFKKVREMAGE